MTVLAVLVALLAATAVARFRFRGRRAYLLVILIVQMVPLEALVIPMYLTLRDADLLNLVPVLIATYMAFVLPFTIWTLRGFVAALPVELEEAAMIDGASRWGAFWRITFPLMAPGLVATGGVRVHPGLERVHPRADADGPGQPDAAGLAAARSRRRRASTGAG